MDSPVMDITGGWEMSIAVLTEHSHISIVVRLKIAHHCAVTDTWAASFVDKRRFLIQSSRNVTAITAPACIYYQLPSFEK
jgi:hypothetical protein